MFYSEIKLAFFFFHCKIKLAFFMFYCEIKLAFYLFYYKIKLSKNFIKEKFFIVQEEVGKKAVKALENVYGTKFRLGTGADILCINFLSSSITNLFFLLICFNAFKIYMNFLFQFVNLLQKFSFFSFFFLSVWNICAICHHFATMTNSK